ncbi:MAG: hypothetical protein LBK82_07740 [Planctomycetaceae bacterium]|nr:hypothetical protein [Planctomycetaceae bacterium]
MKKFQILLLWVVMTWLILPVGCNKPHAIKTYIVTGNITLNGHPLSNAGVNFNPQGSVGNAAYGITDENGTYKLQTLQGESDAGTTPGEYIVTIHKSVSETTGKKIIDPDTRELVDELKTKEIVPDIYKNPQKTKLTAVVVAGQTNTFDFNLKSK